MCGKNAEFLKVTPGRYVMQTVGFKFKSTTKNYMMPSVPQNFKCYFGDKVTVKTGTQTCKEFRLCKWCA